MKTMSAPVKMTLFFILLACFFLFCFYFLKEIVLLADENDYFLSITEITKGHMTQNTLLRDSALPGYIFTLSALVKLTGSVSIQTVRLVSLIFSFASVVVFFLAARIISGRFAYTKTLQYVFSPVYFPFFFLIYTDIFSLLFVMLFFYLYLRKHYIASGIFTLLSLCIRQDNLFWIGFLFLLAIVDTHAYTLQKKALGKLLKQTAISLAGILILGIFIVFNGGSASMGGKQYTPISVHLGNIYFYLFLLFIFFLPMHCVNIRKIFHFLKEKPWVLVIFAVFNLTVFFFQIDHPLNQMTHYYFLRNRLFSIIFHTFTYKIILYVVLLWTELSCCVVQFWENKYYYIYPVILLSLSFHWMIEPRYLFPSLLFFILFKKEKNISLEIDTIMYFILLTAVIMLGILAGRFFP